MKAQLLSLMMIFGSAACGTSGQQKEAAQSETTAIAGRAGDSDRYIWHVFQAESGLGYPPSCWFETSIPRNLKDPHARKAAAESAAKPLNSAPIDARKVVANLELERDSWGDSSGQAFGTGLTLAFVSATGAVWVGGTVAATLGLLGVGVGLVSIPVLGISGSIAYSNLDEARTAIIEDVRSGGSQVHRVNGSSIKDVATFVSAESRFGTAQCPTVAEALKLLKFE